MDHIKKGIQYAFQTQNNMTIAMSGSGHTAMECAIFNAVEPGESVLMAVNGIWGERAAEIAERIGTLVFQCTSEMYCFLLGVSVHWVYYEMLLVIHRISKLRLTTAWFACFILSI